MWMRKKRGWEGENIWVINYISSSLPVDELTHVRKRIIELLLCKKPSLVSISELRGASSNIVKGRKLISLINSFLFLFSCYNFKYLDWGGIFLEWYALSVSLLITHWGSSLKRLLCLRSNSILRDSDCPLSTSQYVLLLTDCFYGLSVSIEQMW